MTCAVLWGGGGWQGGGGTVMVWTKRQRGLRDNVRRVGPVELRWLIGLQLRAEDLRTVLSYYQRLGIGLKE